MTTSAAMQRALSWDRERVGSSTERKQLRSYTVLQLATAGLLAIDEELEATELVGYSRELLESLREKNRLLAAHRAPIDQRIEKFLAHYFRELGLKEPLRLPSKALVLDRHGMARELSLPAKGDVFKSELLDSFRCYNGVLHNPRSDRRTTAVRSMFVMEVCRYLVTSGLCRWWLLRICFARRFKRHRIL